MGGTGVGAVTAEDGVGAGAGAIGVYRWAAELERRCLVAGSWLVAVLLLVLLLLLLDRCWITEAIECNGADMKELVDVVVVVGVGDAQGFDG